VSAFSFEGLLQRIYVERVSNTNNIIVPVASFNKCICTDNSEIEVDVNNLTEKAA
jgi:5-formaminoimidazole-4-carboxamide-1-beta-D-ribofuranosyl 5'-monophosphate synthetase